MDETEAPPPHAGERLTREDVLRLIEEHGGPEGLDLRRANLREANLAVLDLHGARLDGANLQGATLIRTKLQGARLQGTFLRAAVLAYANLQRANLFGADLKAAILLNADLQQAELFTAKLQGASLTQANLQGAMLQGANLQGAGLKEADLRGVHLAHASLGDANLERANWGDYKLGDEVKKFFDEAASVYRALKQWHTNAGMYDIAGEFHYREMEARRKLAQKELHAPAILAMNVLRLLYGYGERPQRVIGWAAAVVLGFALGHWLSGTVAGAFLEALYYSAVSFTALGYGTWAPDPQGWAGRFLGAGESFMGVFMIALFLVTFTRKMTR